MDTHAVRHLRSGRPHVPRIRTAVPRLSSRFLSRPRLDAVIDGAADGRVVLLSASAGYGKTLLLADWVTRHPDAVAWLTLDDDDNDDRRFWAAVLAALTGCGAVPADSALHTLDLPENPSRDPGFLPAVLDALDAVTAPLTTPLTLVLDDVHELTHVDPLHGLAVLVRDRPAHLRLVLSTRLDPPVRLGRLRVSGELVELRAPELALTLEESAAVLVAAEVDLSPAQLAVLHGQTEGWPAGLQLAGLSLRDADDVDLFLTDLVGNALAISDYLVGEVLSRLPAPVVDMLRAVSVCDRLTASLAVAVSGDDAAGDVLAALERNTSLVVSYGSGRQWFRIHPLLRAQLRADLQRRRPDLVAALHERAVRWLAVAEAPSAALRHAHLAGEPRIVLDLLREHGAMLAISGHHAEVCAAVDAHGPFPDDVALLLIGALANLEYGRAEIADAQLRRVDAVWTAEPDNRLESLRTIVRARRSWHGTASPDPRPVVGSGAAGGLPGLDVVELLLRANSVMVPGRLPEAERLARAAVERAGREGNGYLAARSTVTLGVVAGMRGDVPRMVELAEQAGRTAPAAVWDGSVSAAFALFLRCYGALLRGNPQDCLRWAAAVDSTLDVMAGPLRRGLTGVLPVLDTVRAAVRFDLGEHRPGLDAMRAARTELPRSRVLDASTLGFVALLEHGAAVHLGLGVHAHTVREWAQERLGESGEVLLMRAAGAAADRGATRSRRDGEARAHLRPLFDGSVPVVVPWTVVEGWILECAVALRAGNRPRARQALQRALSASQAMGVLRPMIGAPAEVADLVAQQLGSLGEAEPLAREVLAIRNARGDGREGGGPRVSLTPRERAVLDRLPTLLSLEEIAEDLDVTANTVKTHVAAIYGKLGVHSRRDAVAAAHRAGLIAAGAGGPS